MTTIVYRDGILAADTAVFDRGTYCGQATKIACAPDGSIGGGAGALGDVARFLDWLCDGKNGPAPEPVDDCTECFWVDPDSRAWWAHKGSCATELKGDYFAIGSGFQLAMGALAMGATAIEAVNICCELDSMTRGPVITLALDGRHE